MQTPEGFLALQPGTKESLAEGVVADMQTALNNLNFQGDIAQSQVKEAKTAAERSLLAIPAVELFNLGEGRYLTRQTTARGVGLMYVLNIKDFKPEEGRYEIENILVEAPQAGKPSEPNVIADLKRTFPPDCKLYLNPKLPGNNTAGSTETQLIPYRNDDRGRKQVETILHEAGHAWRNLFMSEAAVGNETKARLKMLPVLGRAALPGRLQKLAEKFIFKGKPFVDAKQVMAIAERSPSALALLFHRAYKQLGVDLTPGASNLEVLKIYESDLMLYEEAASVVPKAVLLKSRRERGIASAWYEKNKDLLNPGILGVRGVSTAFLLEAVKSDGFPPSPNILFMEPSFFYFDSSLIGINNAGRFAEFRERQSRIISEINPVYQELISEEDIAEGQVPEALANDPATAEDVKRLQNIFATAKGIVIALNREAANNHSMKTETDSEMAVDHGKVLLLPGNEKPVETRSFPLDIVDHVVCLDPASWEKCKELEKKGIKLVKGF